MLIYRYTRGTMNGILAIEKPSGLSSSKFLDKLQSVFSNSVVFEKDLQAAKELKLSQLKSDTKWTEQRIANKVKNLKLKMGHGGTLDPLASGVMIVGLGSGTKKLQYYLTGCNKTYKTKALLGISTTTGDSEGEIITKNPVDHVTKEMVLNTAEKFVGDIKQTPPIFSALKMNGKPLYDYAREGIPLPKAIKPREVKVFGIDVHEEDSLSTDHEFVKLESQLDENGVPKEHQLANNPTLNDSPLYFSREYSEKSGTEEETKVIPKAFAEGEQLPEKLPMIHLTCDVSSGTYIRSLISDYGRALETSAYMVELIRSRQSAWELNKNVFKIEDFTDRDPRVWGPVLEKVFQDGDKVILEDLFKEYTEKVKSEDEAKEIEESTPSDETKDVTVSESELPKKRSIEDVE
ncbi:tRNA pseudouridine synthase 4 [[Candida] anglica]